MPPLCTRCYPGSVIVELQNRSKLIYSITWLQVRRTAGQSLPTSRQDDCVVASCEQLALLRAAKLRIAAIAPSNLPTGAPLSAGAPYQTCTSFCAACIARFEHRPVDRDPTPKPSLLLVPCRI